MISISQSIKYNIDENNNYFGKLFVSKFLKAKESYKIPFQKTAKKTLVKIGNGDYNDFVSFVISALNDYYTKLSTPSDLDTKEKMLENYTRLHKLWVDLCKAKDVNDVVQINELYDKLSYGLYLLGYEDKQL